MVSLSAEEPDGKNNKTSGQGATYMMKKTLLALTTIAAVSLCSMSQSFAFQLGGLARQNEFDGVRKNAPLQMQLFCLQNPQDCKPSRKDVVLHTAKVERLIKSVNAAVNREIKPRRDKKDIWSVNVREGDCDDYVMTKRQRLVQAGLPSSALRVATVRTLGGEGHAVLIVNTSKGEFVLDNLGKTVVNRKNTDYNYVSVSTGNPLVWTR